MCSMSMSMPSFLLRLCTLLGLLTMSYLTGCSPEPGPTPTNQRAWFDAARWENRIIVIYGEEPLRREQIEHLQSDRAGLLDRNLVVIDASAEPAAVVAGTGPQEPLPTASTFISRFTIPTGGFTCSLVGKDGRMKERRVTIFRNDELYPIIDAMPMRMREMREQKSEESGQP